MSHFLYIHKDLSNVKGVWKVGVAMTPYSAVRARQKFCWNKFGLDYLYFGIPDDVVFLEKRIKQNLRRFSGKELQGRGANTEMMKIDIAYLLNEIEDIVKKFDLRVHQLTLNEPYSAANSGDCPFGIPSEEYARDHLNRRAKEFFKVHYIDRPKKIKLSAKSMFEDLFEVC
jgi:hypothetical protein